MAELVMACDSSVIAYTDCSGFSWGNPAWVRIPLLSSFLLFVVLSTYVEGLSDETSQWGTNYRLLAEGNGRARLHGGAYWMLVIIRGKMSMLFVPREELVRTQKQDTRHKTRVPQQFRTLHTFNYYMIRVLGGNSLSRFRLYL